MEKILMYLQGAVAIVITFGLAVFVHEFGHMFFALIRGVGVESFAIGMGPKITSWKWRGIDFSLRWFPVGGFVKLQGRTPALDEAQAHADAADVLHEAAQGDVTTAAKTPDDKSLTESSYDDLFALQDKGFVTKVMVFGGGVFMNYVTAVLTISLVLFVGFKVDLFRLKVEKVAPDSVLAKAGVASGDQIVAINGKPATFTSDYEEIINKELEKAGVNPAASDKDESAGTKINITLTVEQGGQKKDAVLPPMNLADLKAFSKSFEESLWRAPVIENVVPNSQADKAGLRKGDLVVAVDAKPVESYSQMVAAISPNIGQQIQLKIKREGKIVEANVTPRAGMAGMEEDPKRGYIGVLVGSLETKKERVNNPFKALVMAQHQAVDRISNLINANVRFFKNASMKDVRENVTGPIGIAAITAKMAQNGLEEALNWFIMLNLLLMIFNLLPIPVLDGGFLMLAVIEGVIRRPVPPKILAPIYTAFVVGFIILMVLISVQDITNWVPRLLH